MGHRAYRPAKRGTVRGNCRRCDLGHPMMPAAERIRQLFHKRFGPLPLVGVVTTGALFILAAIFENWISGVAVPYFLAGVRSLLALPVGVFGLLFFALLIAVV